MHLKQIFQEELFEKVFWLREVAEQRDDLFTSGAVNMKKEVLTQGRKWHLKRKEETSMQQRQGRRQKRHAVSWASDSELDCLKPHQERPSLSLWPTLDGDMELCHKSVSSSLLFDIEFI